MVVVFISYARKNRDLLGRLLMHLTPLVRQKIISDPLYDERITAGEVWDPKIMAQMSEAHVILLLITPEFVHSDFIVDREVKYALERHVAGECRVIPIIGSSANTQGLGITQLNRLPTNKLAIDQHERENEVLRDVTYGISRAIFGLLGEYSGAKEGEQPSEDEVSRLVSKMKATPGGAGKLISNARAKEKKSSTPRESRASVALMAAAAIVVTVVLLVINIPSSATPALPTRSTQQSPPTEALAASSPSVDATNPTIALQLEADADKARAESLAGKWVPQIFSTKREGLDVQTWKDFEDLRKLHGDAILIRSEDFSGYTEGYWVAFVAKSFSTTDDVTSWCKQQASYNPNRCRPKKLDHG